MTSQTKLQVAKRQFLAWKTYEAAMFFACPHSQVSDEVTNSHDIWCQRYATQATLTS
jgi:hypothetical protein